MKKINRKKQALIGFLVVLILSPLLMTGVLEKIKTAVLSDVLINLTNEDRQANELETLEYSQLLTDAAQLKANHMAELGYFEHIAPDGKDLRHWLEEVDYNFLHAGENLAVKFNTSEGVAKAWMDSPSHRKNVLGAQFSEIGIATASGLYKGKETTFVVQMFGKPKPTIADAGLEVVEIEEREDDVRTMTHTLSFNENDEVEETLFVAISTNDASSDVKKEVEVEKSEEEVVFPSKEFVTDFSAAVQQITNLMF